MKNKSAVVITLGAIGLLASVVFSAPGVRGAKAFTTTALSTTPTIVTKSPGVVYSVVIGTGAVTDFVVLFDSANATAAVLGLQTAASGYMGRFYASSATQNTQYTFDPPLQFRNGITAVNATAVMTSGVAFEAGRVTQGY